MTSLKLIETWNYRKKSELRPGRKIEGRAINFELDFPLVLVFLTWNIISQTSKHH